jgi:DNA (cytosine-5)-methyltransferase 1
VVGRSRNKGKKGYRPENDGRNFLYLEYLRVINRVRPEVFVMENVRGILSAKVGGRRIFEDILRDLRHPGRVVAGSGTPHENLEYRIHSLVVEGEDLKPEDYLIRSEQYGVPQTRHRVILLGVRSDIACRPGVLQPATASVTVRQMLLDLPDVRSRLSRVKDSPEAWRRSIIDAAHEMRRTVHGIPKEVRENIAYWQAAIVDQNLKASFGDCYPAGEPAPDPTLPVELRNWIRGRSNVLTGHESRSHQPQDLHRYFFAACWADSRGETPSSSEFPDLLAPDHENWKSGHFADRFRVQLLDSPSKTITCHIARDGHYYIHPLPSQCRSFTPREAARIQTFPDDYHFLGPRTSQYVQIGNAVPPWLSRQIAGIVHDLLA